MCNNSKVLQEMAVGEFSKMLLSSSGFKRGVDYKIGEDGLCFNVNMDVVKKRKLTSALSQTFPAFCFSWESPRTLNWF